MTNISSTFVSGDAVDTMLVRFSESIQPWQLPALRGAIAHKAGIEHELFHNHNNETGGYHYRYPLIQYKFDYRAGVPVLMCMKEGVHAMHHFFSKPDWELSLNGSAYPVRIKNIELRKHTFRLLDEPRRFYVKNWLPFNNDNYSEWVRSDSLLSRVSLLDRILTNQLAAVSRSMGLPDDARFEVKIEDIKDQRWADYKKVKMLCFDVAFSGSLLLPDFLGIGQGASTGWGVVKGLRG